MPSTDRLNFSEEKIFKTIGECLQKQDGKTKNIIDCKEDIVFIWDNKERRLLTQNLKILKKDAPVYQGLLMPFIFLTCAALLTGHALAAASETGDRIWRVQQLLPPVLVAGEAPKLTPLIDRMADLKVPGVSITVLHQGKIEWERGFGVASVGGAAVTTNTLFQAASISKPVFALAVLHLVDAGKLDLDANVNDYLKTWKLPDNEFTRQQNVTLRRILSHSAGLTVHGFSGYEAGTPLPTTVQILDGEPPANSAAVRVNVVPGTLYRYSGGGYTLAQQLLTDVTGVPLPKLMNDSVLFPLGMIRSTYEQPLPKSRASEISQAYREDGTSVIGGPHVYPEMAAAGLWTTPSDLARYALGVREALVGNSEIISAKTARMMVTPVLGGHGVGPEVGGATSRKYYYHGGSNEGYRCIFVAYEDGEGAVVMTNGDNGYLLMYEVIRTIAQVYNWPDFAPPVRKLVTVKPESLDKLIGVYQLDDKTLYVVRKVDGKLVGRIASDGPTALFPSSDLELFSREENMVATFTANASGVVTSVRYRVDEWERNGTRVDEDIARKVIESEERLAQRVKEQRADPRTEAALRKLVREIISGTPDYVSISPELAEVIRQQLQELKDWLGGLGNMKSVTFGKVTGSGVDQYLVEFEKSKVTIGIRLNEEGLMEHASLSPAGTPFLETNMAFDFKALKSNTVIVIIACQLFLFW